MPGRRKCEAGCTCKKHTQTTTKEREQRHREQSREGMTRWRERNPGPGRKIMTAEEREAAEKRRKERNRQYMRDRRANDPDGAWVAKERERNRIHGRRYFLKSKFGLTLEQWDALLIGQLGCCYLCGDQLLNRIDVDHDHGCCPVNRSCGKCIRGLACQKCNQGIGQFGDDPERMRRVADRLEAAQVSLRRRLS